MKRKADHVHGLESTGSSPSRHLPPSPPQNVAESPYACPRTDDFSPNASIALVGLRGVGKSTIGVILSSSLHRRLIDGDVYFVNSTGMSIAQYVKIHGWPGFRAREAELMDEILRENETDTIIVCSSGCVETGSTRALLKQWMERHPVIHIIRNEAEIQDYLRPVSPSSSSALPPEDTFRRLLARREPMYSSCSNLVFYNMWDKQQQPTVSTGRYSQSSPTLKHVEQDFLRLLNFVFRREMAPVWDRQHGPHTSSAPGPTAIEDRLYTYALRVPPARSFGTLDQTLVGLEEVGETVDAFDLRIDFLLDSNSNSDSDTRQFSTLCFISEQFATLRRQSSVPIVYHVKTKDQGGCYPASPRNVNEEQAYFGLLYHGLRLGAEYLVVEFGFSDQSIRDLVVRKGATKIIGSFFETRQGEEFGWSNSERLRVYERGAMLDCDLVKLSQRARNTEDNFAAISFAYDIDRRRKASEAKGLGKLPRLICFNTGSKGKLSRILNKTLSPVTHPALVARQQETSSEDIDTSNEEDITPKEAITAIYACGILPRLDFCVLGSAIRHSLSPAMHNAACKAYGMPHNYGFCETPTINNFLAVAQSPSFGGASVTLPFKLEIIPFLHNLSDHAKAIGAVNTVIPLRSTDSDGKEAPLALHGDNTDWIGIRTCILRCLTPVNAITHSTTALVIGAGGMARAAIYALQKIGVENIFLCNRTAERAINIAQYFNGKNISGCSTPISRRPSSSPAGHVVWYLPLSEAVWPAGHRLPTIIVSCIPAHSILGAPPANFTLPDKWLESPTGGVCIELAYKPRVTPLLRQVRTLAHRGWIGVDGLEVLPEQGFAQFELFLGREAPRRVMRNAVESAGESNTS
ncbi:type I 3-dehydroquinase-domain-containing protein [Trichophaea hybrida]|nr:type I 3-dehydroquinase-domain-containing protein [Trichophaea hybrida]